MLVLVENGNRVEIALSTAEYPVVTITGDESLKEIVERRLVPPAKAREALR